MDNLNINNSVTVRVILSFCWFYYVKTHNVRGIEFHEVGKALDCYGYKNGCFVYICKKWENMSSKVWAAILVT